jgi:predicted O-linked N-acetylglucosamine transferase (SPINDLY family)
MCFITVRRFVNVEARQVWMAKQSKSRAGIDRLREAMAAHQAGRLDEAEGLYRRVLKADGKQFPALMMFGMLSAQRGRLEEAERLLRSALAINSGNTDVHYNYGTVLLGLQRFDEAFEAFGNALALNPSLAEAHLNRGGILLSQKRYEEALGCFDVAIRINQNYSDAYCNRGNALEELKRFDEALASYDTALTISPKNPEFHAGRANVLHSLKRYDEALAGLSVALSLRPGNAGFHYNRGNILFELKRFGAAFEAYDKALTLEPDHEYAEMSRLQAKMHLCNWQDFDAECAHLILSVKKEILSQPFALLAVSASADVQLKSAMALSKAKFPTAKNPMWRGRRFDHDRIRLAYLSADFGRHAVTTLVAGVFEQHDRKKFETTAISFEAHGQSEMLTRLKGSFDRFVDVGSQSDRDVARLIRDFEIDIAVDLMGYTRRARPSVLAFRPAPIQVNYLGFPGSMGAQFIDYIIADPFIVPEKQRNFYSEKIIYLPETFQANDPKRDIAKDILSRVEVGLPENAFVFCSFNNSYKITPTSFDIWMRLLNQVEGGVLWLLGGDNDLECNLRQEAKNRGVDSGRLIFCSRTTYAKYLARYRLADLFLDTFPFNAGTTASDALLAGLPIVTYSGETFASRMAGSLLYAVGLPELVTASVSEYENLARQLARDPGRLAAIKAKLARNRDTYPLFDTARFTRHLESAFTAIHDKLRHGLPPATFAVEPSA